MRTADPIGTRCASAKSLNLGINKGGHRMMPAFM
jgi:hypothetical protein